MIFYCSADSWNRLLHATREVMEGKGKQSVTRLIRVNHLKGWGAKPLV